MDVTGRDRLLNLLARTTSEHDGEALAAARKANQFLARQGLTWVDVISAARHRPPVGGPGDTRLGMRVSETPHAILGPIPAHRFGTSLLRDEAQIAKPSIARLT